MCGIAGIVDFKSPIANEALGPMLDVIEHRGPDDEGRFDSEDFSIGMRRLSIIDLEGGSQPIFDESGSIGVVMNGEIYNYVELKKELKREHRFKTASDTEVAVHLYEECGTDFVKQLNGMFGMALWNVERRQCFLFRDPLGIKPLYWMYENGRLVFASEIKSLLKGPLPPGELDRDAIAMYLHLGYIPRLKTPFRNIKKVPPGCMLCFTANDPPLQFPYWRLDSAFHDSRDLSEDEIVEQAGALLEDAVKIRLRSDVKVGTFLSGGMDSSGVTQIASSFQSGIDSFGVKFEDHHFDESEYARRLAEHAGTTHHELTVDPISLVDHLEKLAWFADEPNWDPALLPSYVICRYARERVKVALSGLGGDELFAGYRRHWEEQKMVSTAARVREHLPRSVRKAAASFAGALHSGAGRKMARRIVPENHAVAFAYGVQQGSDDVMEQTAPWAVRAFATTEWVTKIFDGEMEQTDPLNQRLYYDSTTYLPDQILAMVDRTSMAVSLEARVPFLDKRLVTLMAGVHGRMKVKEGEGKILLKKVLRGRVPDQVLDRPKLGFGAPVRRWVTSPNLEAYLREVPRGRLNTDSIIDGPAVEKLIDDVEARQRHAGYLWTLMMLDCWMKQFIP